MRPKLTLLSIIGFVFVIVWVFFREEVVSLSHHQVFSRHMNYICDALHQKHVGEDALCSLPIPEIEYFKWHYAKIRADDEGWFVSHNWKFYPEANCSNGELRFQFMGRGFHCEDGKGKADDSGPNARVVSAPSIAHAEQLPVISCYGRRDNETLKRVQEILPDGTIVVEGGEKAVLLGVTLPNKDQGDSERCLEQSLAYLKARLVGKPVFLIPERNSDRDQESRLRAYVVLQDGEFFNRELVRYGLARVRELTPGERPLRCANELNEMERLTKAKQLGVWGGC